MQCKATLGRATLMFEGASAGCQTEASARWSDSTLTCATPALTPVAARDRLARRGRLSKYIRVTYWPN